MILLFTACFRGFFSEQPKYQATEYLVDTPRIVAVRNHPLELVSGAPMVIDALLLAPKEAVIGDWKASVCGLSRNVMTIIWNITCFENAEEVTVLATGSSMPLNFSIPTFPEMDDCTSSWGDQEKDTGWEEESCSHYLPTLVETTVDDQPVYAASFSSWYPSQPEDSNLPLDDIPIGFHVPETATAGEELSIQIELHGDLRYAYFHWYIDAGTLLDTGITAANEYSSPNSAYPNGITKSSNRLVIPSDYQGELRIWVVIHSSWGAIDMVWRNSVVEVQ